MKISESQFDGIATSEIILGNRFLYQNQVDLFGAIPPNVEINLIKGLSSIRPFWLQNSSQHTSIVVLCGGDNGYLLNLLDSIASKTCDYYLNVMLFPYYGDIKNQDILKAIPWIQIIESNDVSELLSKIKTSETLFINQHERLSIDCIDELIASFAINHKIASVGAKILSSDLTLIEAGGLCFSDTGPISVGAGDNPNLSQYCYAREVNFFSGCFATKTEILKKLHVDIENLNFLSYFHALQAEGLINYLQPLAKTIFFSTSESKLTWRNQISFLGHESRDEVREKWPAFYMGKSRENKYIGMPKLGHMLYIDFALPDPNADAGSVTAMRLMKTFLSLGWRISFVPTIVTKYHERLSTALARIGVEVLHSDQYENFDSITEQYRESVNFIFAVRVLVLAPLIYAINQSYPKAPLAFFNCDLHYLRMMRDSELNNDSRMMVDSILTKKEELICFKRAHCSIVHTLEEAELVMDEIPSLKKPILLPFVAPIVHSKAPYSDRIDVMFLGGYEHLPNVDAAIYFTKEIWPNIRERLPEGSRLLLVGSKPSVEVKALQSSDVIVTGQVPDLEPYFERAKVFIAPLRYGAGVKGKVITALAHGVPTVATDIATEGIEIIHEEQVLCANGANDFAENVIRLYENEDLWNTLQEKGYEFALNNASEGIYEKICKDIVTEAYAEWMIRKNKEIFSELNPSISIYTGNST